MTKKKPDCCMCGVCCVCPRDLECYCDVTPEDLERLSEKFIRDNVSLCRYIDTLTAMTDGKRPMGGVIHTKWRTMRNGPFRGYEMNTCMALRGSVMGKVSCSIYKNRPEVCRTAIKPGDKECRNVRSAFKRTIKDLRLPEGDGLYRAYLHGVR